jgi:hypothetical protein
MNIQIKIKSNLMNFLNKGLCKNRIAFVFKKLKKIFQKKILKMEEEKKSSSVTIEIQNYIEKEFNRTVLPTLQGIHT